MVVVSGDNATGQTGVCVRTTCMNTTCSSWATWRQVVACSEWCWFLMAWCGPTMPHLPGDCSTFPSATS